MTDKELLEMAAKAAGIKKDDSPYNGGGQGNYGFDCMGNMVTDWHNNKLWNPLADDGDALRLLVKLDLPIQTTHCQVAVFNEWERHNQTDKMELLRRLIVRAAAEIGKVMP